MRYSWRSHSFWLPAYFAALVVVVLGGAPDLSDFPACARNAAILYIQQHPNDCALDWVCYCRDPELVKALPGVFHRSCPPAEAKIAMRWAENACEKYAGVTITPTSSGITVSTANTAVQTKTRGVASTSAFETVSSVFSGSSTAKASNSATPVLQTTTPASSTGEAPITMGTQPGIYPTISPGGSGGIGGLNTTASPPPFPGSARPGRVGEPMHSLRALLTPLLSAIGVILALW